MVCFNELASAGYICLMSSPGHFNVLRGVDGPPVVPRAAHTHAVNRRMFDASHKSWQLIQRNYCLTHVHRFPQDFPGVHILNNPVIAFTQETTPVANDPFPRCAAEVPHDSETRSVTSSDCNNMSSRRSERIAKKRQDSPCYAQNNGINPDVAFSGKSTHINDSTESNSCLLYTSDAADE